MLTAARGGLLAALLAGCTSAGATQRGAVLRPVCAPNDASAVMLEVPASTREFPRFRLRMTGQLGDVAGETITVANPDAEAPYADWCDGSECRVVRSATATTAAFGPLRADSSVSVRLRTTMADGKPFAWNGIARWRGETLVCG